MKVILKAIGRSEFSNELSLDYERAGAGQWRFKKEVIDKWISEQSLERVLQNVKSFPAGKSDKKLR